MEDHDHYMNLALQLAEKGRGTVSPNPMVGCVIVKDGKIVGTGYNRKAGGPHAEAFALRRAGNKARGAVMYVTLEPCSHFGRTPPCTKAIISAGIREAVVAVRDPSPGMRGIEDLKRAGVKAVVGVMEDEARRKNEVFMKYTKVKLPFVTLKLAVTLDGSIAASTGSSRYITSKGSQKMVHGLRTEVDAVMVGKNTVLKDNPRLTPRLARGKDPLKIVVDSRAEIPLSCNLMKNPQKLIIATTGKAKKEKVGALERRGATIITCPSLGGKVDLNYLMKELGKRDVTGILLEGGAELAAAALRAGIVDKMMVFIAPKIAGKGIQAVGDLGIRDMGKALALKDIKIKRVADDVLVEGYP